jgi:hypothetical protein
MLRASAGHNYSPKSPDDAAMSPESFIQSVIAAETLRIPRESG